MLWIKQWEQKLLEHFKGFRRTISFNPYTCRHTRNVKQIIYLVYAASNRKLYPCYRNQLDITSYTIQNYKLQRKSYFQQSLARIECNASDVINTYMKL